MIKKVIVASDKPYPVAMKICEYLRSKGIEIICMGALKDGKPVPWPIAGYEAAKSLAKGLADTAILMCYTGTGITIVSNKVKRVWAAPCLDPETAKLARLLNNANALTLSARLVTENLAKEIIDAWFSVEKPDASRINRFQMLKKIEDSEFK